MKESRQPSDIPLTGKFMKAVIGNFAQKPINGDDTWEHMSIGVARNSVVATDSQSAVIIGENAELHVATLRKEALLEAERSALYGDPVRIDDILRNIDMESGEAKPMPHVQASVRKSMAGMQALATVLPDALVAIGKLAQAAGADHVNLLQPKDAKEVLGFQFTFQPAQEHRNLFSTWEGPVEVRGVFKAEKSLHKVKEDEDAQPDLEIMAPTRRTPKKSAASHLVVVEGDQQEEEITVPAPEVPVDLDSSAERGAYKLPPLSVLAEPSTTEADPGDYKPKIEQILRERNLPGRIQKSIVGPTVTLYELAIPANVPMKKYTALEQDLHLQLGVKSVRIDVVQGKGVLGIEIPNVKPRMVSLREICARNAFVDSPNRLAVALGQNISGDPVYGDLATMPHLLVAGATNGGKSIGIAALITSLLMRNTPRDLRLVMIDPKRVELTLFDAIPHLMCPVIKDVKEAPGVLRAVWREMDRRYDLLSAEGVRNIQKWNEKAEETAKMPYIVVVIDELADLMMSARAEVETSITRITQMARAVGIHMVVATQRPSVDVITGLIKSNIPSRIAFATASQIDSRTILDTKGAEGLLGRGDMLFNPIGAMTATRVQGAYVGEDEIAAVCKFWREQESPDYILEVAADEESLERPEEGGEDSLWAEAVRFVVDRGQASTSMLQRRFTIGFQRASRLLERMEEKTVIGPRDGPRAREVLMTPLDVEELLNG